jgi:beta-galactosidase
MELGVCYYPEHWPESWWADDAAAMAAMGLSRVRIGKFAWSRLEPEPGHFAWEWLDCAIESLAAAGLKIVLGTPTATPPKWLVDREPDILAHDAHGRPRRFGSRRHYCFSSLTYRAECARIVTAMAHRYGRLPAIVAWQTDNEFGCHDTVVSYSPAAAAGFRMWLKAKYGGIDALNRAWGNVFWSMEYRSFAEIDPPNETVTESNPAHRMDYRRFASDEVVAFNRVQTEILRTLAPGQEVLHNFMGAFTQFDHFKVARDLDVATWDSYPLGFLDQSRWPNETKVKFARQGHPDFTAFHHDLYRGVGRGRWQVMEQQPGPVNWARWNPSPLPGMVRAWTWEAFAHGAEVVSYFRWRQAPFAQEQMHAGLHRPDRAEAPAAGEARAVAAEMRALAIGPTRRADVALVFDYEAQWLFEIQPQGADFRYFELVLAFYEIARSFGWDVDAISPHDALNEYRLVLAPSLPVVPDDFVERAQASPARFLFGPRTGSKTREVQIPSTLAPGPLQDLFGVKVTHVESLRPGVQEKVGGHFVSRWLEHVETTLAANLSTDAGVGFWFSNERYDYVAAWPDADLLRHILAANGDAAGLDRLALPDGLRLRRRGDVRFAINYAPTPLALSSVGIAPAHFLLGQDVLAPAGVAAWRDQS